MGAHENVHCGAFGDADRAWPGLFGGVQGQVSRTNMDNSTSQYGGGTAQVSQNRTVTTANDANNTHSITTSIAGVPGAVAYAWFWGAAGQEVRTRLRQARLSPGVLGGD